MRALLLAPYYIHWHYGRALKNTLIISQNSIWFLWHFFSIKELSFTLFSPWQRLDVQHEKHSFDIEAYLSVLAVNGVMRVTGAIIRLVFIIFGLAFIISTFILTIVFLILWLALPAVIIFLLVLGVVLLFK
jgi:hypothetical protein